MLGEIETLHLSSLKYYILNITWFPPSLISGIFIEVYSK
jgi:hypothetical protein